jgi:glutamyl-tRNA reductase
MAAWAVAVLRQRGVAQVRVANRSPERARSLAERHGGEGHGLDAMGRALAGTDVIVACTGAAGVIVRERDVLDAQAGRSGVRPMFVLDLAVPRDVEASVGALPAVTLANVDDLASTVERGAEARASLEAGRAIVAEEVSRFAAWRRSARLAPLIHALRTRADRIREDELERIAPRLAGLTPLEREAVESMASAIVAKLLHHPIVRTKDLTAGPGPADRHARALADLFGLEYRPGP